jgi:hypothetical protein
MGPEAAPAKAPNGEMAPLPKAPKSDPSASIQRTGLPEIYLGQTCLFIDSKKTIAAQDSRRPLGLR